ncbi:helix-turn-helix transcriptional regulator [Paenibacillus sinopodophylli]|uniref:helix-turn-helix transcriptional regulator n=1 Tax=Paenibacillus sinopodophylli TaxID=1837342 RepID=UPI00110CCFE6|nr:helix-turn-helix transcriptional regulator [Paenibacillus sinopodophylli]
MDFQTDISDEYARQRGNAILSFLLDCVRDGRRIKIERELSTPEIQSYTKLIFSDRLSFTYMVVQFLWPQIVRSAVEGGMSEMVASGIYRNYIQKAQHAKTVQALLDLHHQVFIEYADNVAIAQGDERYSPLVRNCHQYIKEHLYESLTVSEIAEALHFSRSHLSHVYKRETGETLSDRIRKEKISEAMQLLEHSSLTLNDIGHKLGFSSQSHFTDIFRRETRITPHQFRLKPVRNQSLSIQK